MGVGLEDETNGIKVVEINIFYSSPLAGAAFGG